MHDPKDWWLIPFHFFTDIFSLCRELQLVLQSRVKTEPGWARWVKESSHEISTLSHLSISDFVQQVQKFSFDSEIVLSYLHSFISISRKLNLILMQLVIMNWCSVFVLNTRCPVMTNTLSHFVYTRASTFSAGFSKPGSSGLPPWPRISRPHRPAHHQAKGLCPQHCHFQLYLSLSCSTWCDHFKSDRGIGSHRWGDGRRLRDPKQVQDKKLPRTGSIFIHLPTARSSLWEKKQYIAIVKWFQIIWICPSRMCTKPRRTPSAALVCCADQIGLLTCRSLIMLSARWGSIFWLWHHHRHHDSHHQPVIMIIRWFT